MRFSRSTLRPAWAGAALLAAYPAAAPGYTATLTAAAPQMIYLQVGVGTFTGGNYTPIQSNGQPTGTPGINTTVNTVSANLTLAAVGNGTAQAMTTDSTATQSYWDGYTFCSVPAQLYIGGFYRTAGGNTTAAQVTAKVPAALIDTTGDTLPFSKITWTSSGNGDTTGNGFLPEIFPGGTFVNGGGVQTVGTMASNTWNESCWTFSYLNNTVPKSGVYSGTVVYTLTTP
ncbi:MAG: hypothetical protein ACLPV8_02775 [Steroidobacteraceae bacterium]